MGSQFPPGYYDATVLKAVEGAFHEVCDTLARDPRWESKNQELRTDVVQQLLNLVGQGITDPLDLREVVLRHFAHRTST